jgi:phosphatidylserine/phosphatidylglycerophosphate/cardiolipin synthase-like enzyme
VRRGVSVRAVTFRKPISDKLNEVGIQAKAWPLQKLMHSKMVIFDNVSVCMGSHNFTGSAVKSNIETSVLFTDQEVAQIKTGFFNNIWQS